MLVEIEAQASLHKPFRHILSKSGAGCPIQGLSGPAFLPHIQSQLFPTKGASSMTFASTWPSRTGNASFPPCQALSARLLFNSCLRPRDTLRAISLATTARVVQSTQANYRNNLLVRAAGKSPMLKASTVMTSICPNQVMSSQPVSHSLVLDLQPPSFGQKFSFELSMKVGLPSAQAKGTEAQTSLPNE